MVAYTHNVFATSCSLNSDVTSDRPSMFVYATMGRKFPTKTNTKLIYLNFVPDNIFWVFRHDDIRHVLCGTMKDSFCIIISFEKDEGEGQAATGVEEAWRVDEWTRREVATLSARV